MTIAPIIDKLQASGPLNANGSPETLAGPWGIAELSEIFGVTPRTLRHYEDKGLVSPSRTSGSRVYSRHDYSRVEKILRAKRLGFSLDDIREVFEVADGHVKDRSELMRRKDNFKRVIKSLERRHLDIKHTAREMTAMCAEMERFIATTPETTKTHTAGDVFVHAAAYEAAFAETLSDADFGVGLSAPDTLNSTL